ncbi:putative reverse transcriptase domain-containing protein [Tanacetum coccineum]
MAPTTRRGPNTPVNNANPNNMTLESIQATIDQALLQNSTNGDGSHSSHGDNRRNLQTARPCFYAVFMKYQPLNFKRTEGVVGSTRWIEKMELVFNISGCAIENQVKFSTCTLLGAALTWWNGQIRTLGPEAYAMTWEILKKKMTDMYCPQGEIKKLEIDVVVGTFLLNNHYASILFDTGTNRSFISTAFSSLINIAPTPLENYFDVELADGKLVRIDTIIRGCTLNFLDHPFNIVLMLVELGSFDVIIVFPEDLPSLPPARLVEFQIDLIPGAAPVARAPYQLASSEMKELSEQLQELSDKGFIRPRIKFNWGEKKENAFQLIKQKLCSAPILALPEGSKDFMVYCDASHKGLGAVLMQREKVIAYVSRQLKVHRKLTLTARFGTRFGRFTLKIWRHIYTEPDASWFQHDHKKPTTLLDTRA